METNCPLCGNAVEDFECVVCGYDVREDCDPREKYDDDGREYADPRDYREELERKS